jgi:tuftelin-interacting protein 11
MNMSVHHSVGFAKPKNHKSYVISSGFHQNLIRFTKVEKMKIAKIDELIQIKEGIFIETIKKKMKINRYMNITKAVESTITFLDQSTMYLKLEDLGAIKIEFRRLFIKEYFFKEFDSLLALYGRTKLRRVMKDWNPIREPKKGLLIIMKWAKRLNIGNSLQNLTTHSFCEEIDLALTDIVFLPIKRITQSIWQVHDPKSLVHLIKYWMHLLPISKLNSLYRVILYFINLAVGTWNPKEYKNSVHNLIIPWLPVLENKLETTFQRIRYKVTLALKNYNITDHLGLLILSPWITIWGEKNWELFCYRYIIPKLQNHFETKFLFNPEQQNFKPLESILKWHGHINNRLKAQVYDLTFFKLFHQILRLWLSQKQTMKEIIRWFVGWKGFFPQDLLDQKCILIQLVNVQMIIKLTQKLNFKRQRQRQLK